MDIVRAAETVGGAVTPADLLLLTSGALAERNVNAAADIARRLSLLLAPAAALPDGRQQQQQQVPQQFAGRYDPAYVLQQYESLADMCIAQRAVQQADVVLEAAEVAGLQPSKGVLERLAAALRGQPRRSEVGDGGVLAKGRVCVCVDRGVARACVCACVRACVHACVRACVQEKSLQRVGSIVDAIGNDSFTMIVKPPVA